MFMMATLELPVYIAGTKFKKYSNTCLVLPYSEPKMELQLFCLFLQFYWLINLLFSLVLKTIRLVFVWIFFSIFTFCKASEFCLDKFYGS